MFLNLELETGGVYIEYKYFYISELETGLKNVICCSSDIVLLAIANLFQVSKLIFLLISHAVLRGSSVADVHALDRPLILKVSPIRSFEGAHVFCYGYGYKPSKR